MFPQTYCKYVYNVICYEMRDNVPDNKVHGANMGPTWVLLAPCGPHVDSMNLAIWGYTRRTFTQKTGKD